MKYSTRTTYGIRAMVKLAQNYDQGSLSLAKIAQEEKMPLKYLERLFSRLKKADLITAEKGASGGYCLSCAPQKITIAKVIEALEGKLALFHCLTENKEINCQKKCDCSVVSVFEKVQTSINKTLGKIKLSDLI